jgi:polar amino acid transport system substrate-binding protein
MRAVAVNKEALRELAPTGTLRVAIAISPAASPFFATREQASGAPRGVTVTLAKELAALVGLPLRLIEYPNSGEITENADNGEWDVTFMPADEERAKRVAFTPPYALVESTYLVAPDCPARTVEEVDRSELRVVAIANTATGRSAARTLKRASLVYAAMVDEAAEMLRTHEVDALALSRDALAVLAARQPGTRMVEGRFHAAGVAGAVPRNRPAALALLSGFVEQAKASGSVQRALDSAGLKYAVVAAPAT